MQDMAIAGPSTASAEGWLVHNAASNVLLMPQEMPGFCLTLLVCNGLRDSETAGREGVYYTHPKSWRRPHPCQWALQSGAHAARPDSQGPHAA